ncbi:MAG: hypothetical protein K0V04_30650, partial [Deltaproteobacteria bacterium]|nr:hypothetical protein [Deltaproteobacteria bacterium]
LADAPIVTWDWERRFVELYVALQKLRFAERLTVGIETTEVSPQIPFPAFVLQPLIENAIRHGPLNDARSCHVLVVVDRRGDRVRVEVRNPLGEGRPRAGAGVGTKNVESRLLALFGEHATFHAGPDGEQFVAIVEFPASRDPIARGEALPCQ